MFLHGNGSPELSFEIPEFVTLIRLAEKVKRTRGTDNRRPCD